MDPALLYPPDGRNPALLSTAPPPGADHDAIRQSTPALLAELNRLQELLHANRRHALLVILQGMDTSGKDSSIRQVFSHLNPLGLDIHAFRAPNDEELSHDFLWRAHVRMPAHGVIGIFNRSYYEAVISDRVQGLCDSATRDSRWRSIRDFEQHLTANNTIICKFWLHISRDEQKKRLLERLSEPEKQWKFSAADLESRRHFAEYLACYGETVAATHTAAVPWHVIPADHKWYRDYCIASTLVQALTRLDMTFPPLRDAIRPEDIAD